MKKQVLILISLAFLIRANAAPLQGVYTLDSTSASSGTNFQTWTDFKNSIVTNGISGAVTLNVLSNCTESGSVTFTSITGASAVNTIRINGNGKYIKTSSTDGVIVLNGADYFTLDSLRVINTSNGIGVRLYNRADHNIINRCRFELSNFSSRSLSTGAFIALSATPSNLTAADASETGRFNRITANTCHTMNLHSPGPAFGIVVSGSNTKYKDSLQGNLIYGNRIYNFYSKGIATMYGNSNVIVRNEVCRKDADTALCNQTVYGIFASEAYTNGGQLRIDSNFVHHLPYDSAVLLRAVANVYGIYVEKHTGSSTLMVSIQSNLIARIRAVTLSCAITSGTCTHVLIKGNAIYDVEMPSVSSNYCMFNGIFSGHKKGILKITDNRIYSCKGAFYWYGIYNGTPLLLDEGIEIENNEIVNNGGAYYAFKGIYTVNNNLNDTSKQTLIRSNRIGKNYGQVRTFYGIHTEIYGSYRIEDNLIDSNVSGTQEFFGIHSYQYQYISIRRNRILYNQAAFATATLYGISTFNDYRVHILSNLIAGNVTGYKSVGINVYEAISAPHGTRIIQNTVVMDGSNSVFNSAVVQPFNLTSYYQGIVFKGNISDVRKVFSMEMSLNTYTKLRSSYNSLFTDTSVKMQIWKSLTGNALSDTALYSMIKDTTSVQCSAGHFFNSGFASTWYYDQNIVPSEADNLSDAYGVTRSSSYSDRGAVEYSGSTGISGPSVKLNLSAYPNPGDGKFTVVSKINTEYRIYDINGKLLLSGNLTEGSNSIDASSMVSGIYYLLSSAGTDVLKLIIQ